MAFDGETGKLFYFKKKLNWAGNFNQSFLCKGEEKNILCGGFLNKIKKPALVACIRTLLTLLCCDRLKRSCAEVKRSTSRMRAVMGTVGRKTLALASLKPTVAYTAENGMRQSPEENTEGSGRGESRACRRLTSGMLRWLSFQDLVPLQATVPVQFNFVL